MCAVVLITALKQCQDLLRNVGETFWSQKIESILASHDTKLSTDDAQELLSWYGGMGSFNDLIISAVNDHNVKPDDEARFNDELSQLRETIYSKAKQLL